MKIQHLIEYQFPKINRVNVDANRHPGRAAGRGDSEFVGGGSFANAWANPKKTPHDIRKLSMPVGRRKIDGFYYYIQALEKNPDNTNPYYPRFRDIKIYTAPYKSIHNDPNLSFTPGGENAADQITYSTSMERLTDMREMSKSENEAIIARLFGTDIAEEDRRFLDAMPKPYQQPLLGIIRAAANPSDGNGERILKMAVDDDFKRAMAFLGKVQKEEGLDFDLHDENIMIRKSPYGPQVVLTDPFSYKNRR